MSERSRLSLALDDAPSNSNGLTRSSLTSSCKKPYAACSRFDDPFEEETPVA